MKIYWAGPLFTQAERTFNVECAKILTADGFNVWLPQEHEPRILAPETIFKTDVEGIDWAQVVVANMDGPDPDSGTAWECGYAYARKKPTVMYRTDFRNNGDIGEAKYNLMLWASATERLYSPFNNIADFTASLCKVLRRLEAEYGY